jgi:hypothetical protein
MQAEDVCAHPAATEEAQGELQTLESELEELKAKMAELKKARAHSLILQRPLVQY